MAAMEPGFYNMDCMEAMRQFPDQFFDLAVVDPPYGDAGSEFVRGGVRFGQRFDRYLEPVRRDLYHMGSSAPEEPGPSNTVKKSLRGTLPRINRTLTNCSASHETRSSGGQLL